MLWLTDVMNITLFNLVSKVVLVVEISTLTCRTPTPQQRPTFRDVLVTTLKDRGVVLCVPPDARKSHPQATSLGAPLKAGHNMYSDLQKMYL